jgi:hypothetical protein
MLRKSLLIFSILCAAILIGCSKTETSNGNSAADNSNKSTASSGTTSSGDKIGIPECDDYIAKYESCTPKVPEAGRAAYKSALDQARATWKKLAADPATRGSLAAACKQATETQAAAWKMYGCAN